LRRAARDNTFRHRQCGKLPSPLRRAHPSRGRQRDARQAETILAAGEADMAALARRFLDDPHRVWHAAEALGAEAACPPQYLRSKPASWPGARIARGEPEARVA